MSLKQLVFILPLVVAGAVWAGEPALLLGTWNLEHLAERTGDGCKPRTDADYARLRHHAERIGADVVALQEVENPAAVARVFDPDVYAIEISRRPHRDLGACRRRPRQARTMQRTGFAINRARLSGLGLIYKRLPDFSHIGSEGRRWATHILLTSRDRHTEPLHLLSVHLKSGCAYGRLDGRVNRGQCRVLIRQRGILEEWIDSRAGADERFLILGDFNRQLDQPNDHFWRAIDDASICNWEEDPALGRRCRPGSEQVNVNADLVLANAGNPFPFPYNRRYPYAIDHILFDAPTGRRLIPGSYLALGYQGDRPAPSDHHPVMISLDLPTAERLGERTYRSKP